MAASGNLGAVVTEALRDVVQIAAAATPRLELLLVFGSVARSQARPISDLDIAILGKDVDTFELAGRLSLATHREVDVVDLARAPIPLLDAVLREGVVLFERTHGAEARFRSHALSMLETDRPWYERMQKAWLKRVAERGILGRP
jgi:predicted nucleotidyltransferase